MKKLNKKQLIKVGSTELYRTNDGNIVISANTKPVRLTFQGFTSEHTLYGNSIADVIRQYNAI